MICEKLKKFLNEKGVDYKIMKHPEAISAQERAASMHVPGKEMAKVVILKGDDKFFMSVLPASYIIVIDVLRKVLYEKNLRLAKEEEIEKLFPDCEVGAMPPFGNLYNVDVYMDKTLSQNKEIVFLAGSHMESVRIKYNDYVALVKPVIVEFAVKMD
jgi:Ala-tRNA(Pro) deacylase